MNIPFQIGHRVLCADRTEDNYLELIRGVIVKLDDTNAEYLDDVRALVRLEAPHIEGIYLLTSIFRDTTTTEIKFGTL